MTKKPWRTKTERKRLRQLKFSEIANHLVLDAPGSTARARSDAETALRKIVKERKALQDVYEGRRQQIASTAEAERNAVEYDKTVAKFPPLSVLPIGDERDALMAKMEAHSETLVGDHNKTAREYLRNRIAELESVRASEKEESEAELENLEDAEFRVADPIKQKIITAANRRLSQPMTMDVRRALQMKLRRMAKECSAFAKTPEAETIDEATQVRKKAIAEAQAEAYASLSRRLSVFGEEWPRYVVENPPSDDDMEELQDFYYGLGCDSSNWNFRTPDGRVTEEQCLLRLAVARYRSRHGYSMDDLPNVPLPTVVPSPWGHNLAFDYAQQDSEIAYRARRQHEFVGERAREVEKFIRLTPAKLEKLAEEKPGEYMRLLRLARTVPDSDDGVRVYRIQQATVEQPNLPPILYWPLGDAVKVGQEILWCRPLNCYVLPPDIAADPLFGVPSRMEAEQNLEGKWVWKPVYIETSRRYEMDNQGKFHPVSSNKPTQIEAQPVRVAILDGDHMPWSDDPRHPKNGGGLRFGHFYSRTDIEAAEKNMASVTPKLPPFYDTGQITKIYPPATPTRDADSWRQHEENLRKKENNYV